MAGRTEALFNELEASFDASVAREEDAAAADLARSFRNDEALAEIVPRSGPLAMVLDDGTLFPVLEVGSDHALGGIDRSVLVHIDRVVFRVGGDSPSPVRANTSWLMVARAWASEGLKVQVRTHEGSFAGRIGSAARDFITVRTERDLVLVPHGRIVYLRSYPED